MNVDAAKRPVRCALVAWNALPAALPRYGTAIGGLETGAWLLARGMATCNTLAPTFVVQHSAAISEKSVDSVHLHTHVDRCSRIRREVAECIEFGPRGSIKRLKPQLLWQLPFLLLTRPFRLRDAEPMRPDPRLENLDTDVWCCFGVNNDSARVVATAKHRAQPVIVFLESNADLDERFVGNAEFVGRYGDTAEECRFALRNATHVVCQSKWQQVKLRERFGIDGSLIRNPIMLDRWKRDQSIEQDYVLWIGRYDDFHKRTELAIEIARGCPELQFLMIVNAHDASVEKDIRAKCPGNVKLVDYVPFVEMPAVFSKACVFLSTGSAEFEGFPNVILQAAASSTPIVSLDDFDDFVESSEAGVVVSSVPNAISQLPDIARDLWSSDRALAYLNKHHHFSVIAAEVEKVLQQVAEVGS